MVGSDLGSCNAASGTELHLVAVTLQPGAGNDDQVGHEIERRLKATDPRILEVLFRFGVAGTRPRAS